MMTKTNINLLKLFLLLAVITAATGTGCGERTPARLRFCSDIRPHNPCIGEDVVFNHGTNVWAQLLLPDEFDDVSVTGKFYGYEDGKRVLIETIVHELTPGQTMVMEALFLNNCGNFEVEFLDSRGKLLAKGGFEIW